LDEECRRHDTWYNGTQQNNTWHIDLQDKDTQYNSTWNNEIHNNDAQYNNTCYNKTQNIDTQHNDPEHNKTQIYVTDNDTENVMVNITPLGIMTPRKMMLSIITLVATKLRILTHST
jgi:hypothetical protein